MNMQLLGITKKSDAVWKTEEQQGRQILSLF
jgi:hypothetical protein